MDNPLWRLLPCGPGLILKSVGNFTTPPPGIGSLGGSPPLIPTSRIPEEKRPPLPPRFEHIVVVQGGVGPGYPVTLRSFRPTAAPHGQSTSLRLIAACRHAVPCRVLAVVGP